MKAIFTSITLLLVFQFVNAQWVRQHPYPKLENINDIEIVNDRLGIAVGNNSVIFKTVDNGDFWEWVESPVEGWDLNTVDIWHNENDTLILIGGNGLLASMDAGATWRDLENAPQGILEMKIMSSNTFIAATTLGVFKSTNGGIDWEDLNLPVVAIQDAHILDQTHFWASTILPEELWMTDDGGDSWIKTTEVVRHDLVHFFDESTGILLDFRDVYQSQNGGQSWTLISDNGLQSNAFHLDYGSDQMHVFAALNGGRINYSTDGGVTWERTNFTNIPNGLAQSVYALNNEDVLYGGEFSTILKSSDQLMTIEETTGGSRRSLTGLDMIDLAKGVAVGTQGTFLKTNDGGENWLNVKTELRNYLAVDFVNDSSIWAGSNQRILHSIDGGMSWDESLVLSTSNIQAIDVVSEDVIIAVNTSGIIYRSADQGMTWDTVFHDVNDNSPFQDIEFTDESIGYVCGFNGRLLKTMDEGLTWNQLTEPVSGLQYEDFNFVSNEKGWLVSSSYEDRMWHTTDGGESWETIQLPVLEFWTGVHFISPDTGVIVHRGNDRGGAYLTFDGGATWPSTQETSFSYNGVAGTKGEKASLWIFGSGGNIEALLNCDAIPSISELLVENIFPCQGDTIKVRIQGSNIEQYVWSFPAGWAPIGNVDTSIVYLVANGSFGYVSVFGRNSCGSTSGLEQQVSTSVVPEVFIEIVNDSLLQLSESADSYQWFLDGLSIPSANMSFHVAQTNGQYYCELIFQNGCRVISDTIEVSMITTSTAYLSDLEVKVMPIPASHFLTIESEHVINSVWIYTSQGAFIDQVINVQNKIDISQLHQGLYIFSLLTAEGYVNVRVPIVR